ncbi:SulP family inorganic anion transporter [Rufibacter latericius]|uniref:SulP family inorganic anion transporter n=1 Tax=Rufibacter latericius TaxID=2487040 RepID=A0A3M9MAJ0_9BACT|nr:SulP family inorganic anion transporter [Rufibacter latericius]RNI22554.1 SulP family inorganic anion transporter [Rufibacter latericius]
MKERGLFSTVGKDLSAGLVVFLVALPLCLGISLASGAPLFAGLIAGVIGGLVVSWASGSQLSVSGPAAGLTVIVINGIQTLGSFEVFLLAVVLCGVFQIILGFLKAGIIGLYFPSSVIKGMLAAIGLILILKQIPHFLGADEDFLGDLNFLQSDGRNTFTEIGYAFSNKLQVGSLIVGVVSLAILILWERSFIQRNSILKLVPGALIAVIVAIGLNLLFQSSSPALAIADSHLVNLPEISGPASLLNELRFPDWAAITNSQVWVIGITLAIVASLESLLSVEAVDKLDPHKRRTPTNRELKAQGIGNVMSGLIGGIPLTAVIVRSSANVNAGGESKLSSFFHGVFLLLSILFLTNVLGLVPLAALAAVLLMVGFKLTKPVLYKTQWRLGMDQFLPFIITIVAILFTDLLKGISIGLVVGVFYILKANYKSPYFFKRENHEGQEKIHIKLSENVSFLNKASVALTLDHLPENSEVIIDGSQSTYIDYDVLEAIQNFRTVAHEKDIRLTLRDIPSVKTIGMH